MLASPVYDSVMPPKKRSHILCVSGLKGNNVNKFSSLDFLTFMKRTDVSRRKLRQQESWKHCGLFEITFYQFNSLTIYQNIFQAIAYQRRKPQRYPPCLLNPNCPVLSIFALSMPEILWSMPRRIWTWRVTQIVAAYKISKTRPFDFSISEVKKKRSSWDWLTGTLRTRKLQWDPGLPQIGGVAPLVLLLTMSSSQQTTARVF